MKPLSVAVLLLMSAFTCKATTFSGTVRDSEGAVIAKAHVVIHWDPAGSHYLGDNVGIKEDITAGTDSDGKFSLELSPGQFSSPATEHEPRVTLQPYFFGRDSGGTIPADR